MVVRLVLLSYFTDLFFFIIILFFSFTSLLHIKLIVCSSIDWYYPDKNTCSALGRIESRLKVELQKQKDVGKQFLSNQEIDNLIDNILNDEQQS